VWRPNPQSGAKATASVPRPSVNIEQQVTERTAKLTRQIADLKTEVAEVKQTGETFRASEELFRSLVENANDGIFTLSLDGTITTANPGFSSLLGKHRDDLIGRHCSIVLSSSSLSSVEEQIRRFRNGEKTPSTLDLDFFHQNGKAVLIETRLLPTIGLEGTAIGIQGICREKPPEPAVVTAQSVPSSVVTPGALPGSLQRSFVNSTLGNTTEFPQSPPVTGSSSAAPPLPPTSSFYTEETSKSFLAPPLPPQSAPRPPSEPMAFSPQPIFSTQPAVQPSLPPIGIPGEQILDLDAALGRVDGDRELLVEMADLFLDEYPRLLTTLRDAVAHGNAQTAAYAAHTLKGSVANFAAMPSFTAAQKLERIARQGDLTQAHAAFADLEAQLTRLKPVLANLKTGMTA
jgi:PAS domain S-box-containing protein